MLGDLPRQLGVLFQHDPISLHPEVFPPLKKGVNLPRICLVTPSFQQAPYLERTMRSVLDQNYPHLSYGVQDGGSTDGSLDIISRYADRLAFSDSRPDTGQADAIQRGFQKLKAGEGDIMAWLNSDDLLSPGTLHFVGEYFARNPEVDAIYGHRIIIDEKDMEIGRWILPRHHPHTLTWFDFVPQETLFWRADCYHAIGGMDTSFNFALDWDLLLRLTEAGAQIRRVPYFLGCFRMHTAQKTQALINTLGEEEMHILRFRTLGRAVNLQEIEPHFERERMQSAFAAWLLRQGIRW